MLITGANRGLGLATVRELVKQQAEVIVACRSSSDALEAAGVAQILQGVDVTDTASVKEMAETCSGSIDLVINNAGYFWEHVRLHSVRRR